ncbi:MAG: nucleotide sugar dehydrogenase [Actinomycetota bacterium]
MTSLSAFVEKIEARSARVGVVGLGYVGLPVAAAFAERGFQVIGVDANPSRIHSIKEGRSYLTDVSDERIGSLLSSGSFEAAASYDALTDADAILVCLPTPLREGAPDLSSVIAGGEAIASVLSPGKLVVLESTTYPGTTDEVLKPRLEAGGLVAGRDFWLAFSPERIDPGNPNYSFSDIPKVVGGIDEDSTRAAAFLYEQVVPKVVTVSGPREAEFAKLIENTFRHVNIALINELALYAEDMGVDIWEAIDAAATKPFGFMPFWPSPGWGGHCIPLDPAYLSWRVRQDRAHEIRFVELAHTVNAEMPRHVVERVTLLLNERGKPVRGSRILAVGAAYKGGTEDTRGAPARQILKSLLSRGADASYHDPLVEELIIGDHLLRSAPLTRENVGAQDLVLVLVPQVGVDWHLIAESAPLIFDCCHALRTSAPNIKRL